MAVKVRWWGTAKLSDVLPGQHFTFYRWSHSKTPDEFDRWIKGWGAMRIEYSGYRRGLKMEDPWITVIRLSDGKVSAALATHEVYLVEYYNEEEPRGPVKPKKKRK